jgi:ankyrin repeat protein
VALDRETIIERLEEIELWPELAGELHIYLSNAVFSKDIQYIEALLKAGANPNPKNDLDCYIYHLLHEYQVEKTTKGDLILSIVELLLKYGTNPNRVWCNNQRAYDYAKAWHVSQFVELLEKYGADMKLREYI